VADQRKRKPRRRSFARVLVSLAAILLIIGGLAAAAAFYAKTAFESPGPLASSRIFAIERGMSTPDIARKLKDAGIISDDKVFLAMAFLTRNHARMRAGEYSIPQHASMAHVMDLIVFGRELVFKVTVPEGWTTAQVIERVSSHDNLEGGISEVPDEGAILPETYVFHRGMTRDRLLDQMKAAQKKLFDELWEKRAPDLPFKTKEQALTLASIVEKETAIPAERPLIAAVFINRLRKSMRLQSDPTIIYGITRGRTKLDRPILKSDIDAVTPYNTYRIAGLPPTPIANPGRESIVAVLNPADSKALYFVADGSGGHVFAETLEEHRKNVRKWRKVEKSITVEAAEAEAEAAEAEAAKAQEASLESPTSTPKSEPAVPQAVLADPPSDDDAAPAETENLAAPAAEAPAVEAKLATSASQDKTKPAQTQAVNAGPKPGSLVIVSGRLVPIPAKRPPHN
jgi:peptidoglycan lytic transglycosylase G